MNKIDPKSLAMGLSLAASILMLVGKLAAYFISGSTAILSDAAESVVHIVATGVAALSLWYASRPADAEHPYGHGRVVSFSVGFEGALILSAALAIFWEAGKALYFGPELRSLGWGLAITAGLAAVNLLLGAFLVQVGKRTGSQLLVANGQHVLTDMWTSVSVVVGVLVVYVTDILWLDPVVGILAGIQIVVTSVKLIRGAISEAMDQVPAKETERIREALESEVKQGTIAGYHQLRHRRVNDVRWVELHMLVPDELTVCDAHRRVSTAEHALQGLFPNEKVLVTTHIEPVTHHEAHPEGHVHDPLGG